MANGDYDELKSFVKGTLTAIMEGIAEIQADARVPSPFGSGVHAYNAPKEVHFDVAVSAERSGAAKGGFALKIMSVGANAGIEEGSKDSTVSRIQFTVRTAFKENEKSDD